ncbi:MAG: tetratricopeptide repeat protein [Ruminococcaceae bacterium]|nr:tetratricopeptide repeat protein [Oscillospiraceae bacterium]
MENNVFENAEEKLKESWEVHRQAFGPILEPAFVENKEIRIHLTAALNLISRREVKKGYDILMSIKKHCLYGEDKAAWNFFMGLCFEFMGSKTEMAKWYEKANLYPHNFYLPYLKLAKFYHADAKFEEAERNYLLAIDCLENAMEEYKDKVVLGSAYVNLTSCLTMMHRYKAAVVNYRKALAFPIQSGTSATGAILYAAMGNIKEVERFLSIVSKEIPALYAHTKKMTDEILERKHPHFSPISLDEKNIEKFWQWFNENKEKIKETDSETVKSLGGKIKEVFAFLEREPRFKIALEENKHQIIFSDFYAMALNIGYKELINKCPDEILKDFGFIIER